LKGKDFIRIQKNIIGAAAAHYLAGLGGTGRRPYRCDMSYLVGDLDGSLEQALGTLHGLLQARFADRLQKIIDGARFESLDGVLNRRR